MKLAIASDLHLEFQDIELKNTEGADGLILAGDILVAEPLHVHPPMTAKEFALIKNPGRNQYHAFDFRNFLSRASFQFPWVIYIAGNHEFYHGKYPGHIQVLRDECARYPNIYFMEQDTKKIGDFTFIGCTLWTNMNKGDPLTMHYATTGMNDYNVIRNDQKGYTKLRPAHTLEVHRKSIDYIKAIVAEKPDENFIVVGHHCPSAQSVPPEYKSDTLMNGNFFSDLDMFILDRPQIKLWFHGHTHTPFDYKIGDTRIVCNPRGYAGYERRANEFELQFVQI